MGGGRPRQDALAAPAGCRPNARSDDGRTLLLVATSWARSYDAVKLLLDRGANPSQVVHGFTPLTPLRLAAQMGDEAVVRLLLDRGAGAKARGGVLPLAAALSADDTHCVNPVRGESGAAAVAAPARSGSPAPTRAVCPPAKGASGGAPNSLPLLHLRSHAGNSRPFALG